MAMKKTLNTILYALIMGSIIAGTICLYNSKNGYRARYAAEHNCRWDYNDMCYTIEEKPWLFE